MRSHTCAEHYIHLSSTSIFASLVWGCQSEHALSQWPSQANSSIETKIVGGCYNARQSLSGVDAIEVVFLFKKSSLFRLRIQPLPLLTRWRNRSHVIGRLPPSRNSSSWAARIIIDATTITTVVNSVVWMRASRYALKTLPVKSAKIGCRRPG